MERLRASPTTPDPAKNDRKEYNGNDRDGHYECQDVGVFRKYHQPKQVEFPVENIQQHEGVPVNLKKGGNYQKE